MQSTNNDAKPSKNEGRANLPKSVSDYISERYAEYVKPELFLQWLVEQELIKRKLDKQQLDFQQQLADSVAYLERDRVGRSFEFDVNV
jgi:hypothetical protein